MDDDPVSRAQRGAFAAIAAVIAVAAIAVVARGGGDSQMASRAPATIRVVDGRPEGGVNVIECEKGDTVELTVTSDTADQMHVHGYDLREPVRLGQPAHLRFEARLEGEFRIELERARQQIAVLRVRP